MRTSAAAEESAQQSHPASGDATLSSTGAQPAPAPVSEAASPQDAAAADSAPAPSDSSPRSRVPTTANGAVGQHLPERSAGPHPELQQSSQLWQQARALREMLRKRALVASRDTRGGVFTLLLPILAVAAVLVTLSIFVVCCQLLHTLRPFSLPALVTHSSADLPIELTRSHVDTPAEHLEGQHRPNCAQYGSDSETLWCGVHHAASCSHVACLHSDERNAVSHCMHIL